MPHRELFVRFPIILACVLAAVIGIARAATTGFPSGVPLADMISPKGDVTVESYGQVEFTLRDKTEIVRGRKWTAPVAIGNFAPDDRRYLDVLADAMEKAGWEVLLRDVPSNPPHATFRRTADKKEMWASIVGMPGDATLSIVERGAPTAALKLEPPPAGVEKVAANADFPFLKRFPGAQLRQTSRDERPLLVILDTGKEPLQVAASMQAKEYRTPAGTGPLEVVVVYRDALKAAGWQMVEENTTVANEPNVTARYAKGPIELWVRVRADGEGYTVAVADAGADRTAAKLKAELDRTCKAAVYGVYFDDDKATLRSDPEPALEAILKLMNDYPDLRLELGGHTDNAGGRDRNAKLSEARVNAVRGWLVGKGVKAERLTAKGYADTQPLDANDSVEGRAKNRRVELRNTDCRM